MRLGFQVTGVLFLALIAHIIDDLSDTFINKWQWNILIMIFIPPILFFLAIGLLNGLLL